MWFFGIAQALCRRLFRPENVPVVFRQIHRFRWLDRKRGNFFNRHFTEFLPVAAANGTSHSHVDSGYLMRDIITGNLFFYLFGSVRAAHGRFQDGQRHVRGRRDAEREKSRRRVSWRGDFRDHVRFSVLETPSRFSICRLTATRRRRPTRSFRANP